MRNKMLRYAGVISFLLLFTTAGFAQSVVRGIVVDDQNYETLIGATVFLDGTGEGVVTALNGSFVLSSNQVGTQTLVISFVGYKEYRKEVTFPGVYDLGRILLQTESIGLNDVTVTASVAVRRKTPVALSVVEPMEIENKLSTQEFPEILKSTPGIYATKQGGGFGDSRVNLRGFESANVAVMINGVPMNDMEWGGIYWSNWAGLSDVTRSTQIQRGLGASMVSSPSVGGSINIVTRSTDAKQGGNISYAMGPDGYNKIAVTVSTGLNNGWAMTVLGAKTWGDGYVQGTEFESYNYFVNISKQINEQHLLSFTAFGAPQTHNQRSNYDGLTIAGWQEVGKWMRPGEQYKYNPTYGFGKDGVRKTSARNLYHKPQISLNHYWTINDLSSLSTVAYVSIGNGSGFSGQGANRNAFYGASNGVLNNDFRDMETGIFDYGKVYDYNAKCINGGEMVMARNWNKHFWVGMVSTYSTKIANLLNVYGGVDLRYYKGVHTNTLEDLYGAKFFIDSSRASVSKENNSIAGTDAYKYEKLGIGDVVYRDYDGLVLQEGAFFQAEYNEGAISAFISGSANNTSYARRDRFYYDPEHEFSGWVNFIGFTGKGGANYNLTEHHNVFANVGYISRVPFFSDGAFLNSTTSHDMNPNAVNEKIFSVEVGYGFKSSWLSADLNAYYTTWQDKTMRNTLTLKDPVTSATVRGRVNMSGVDALHKGLELELTAKPVETLTIKGMLGLGDWKWQSKSRGYFYNDYGQAINEMGQTDGVVEHGDNHAWTEIDLTDARVGNSAQSSAALGISYKPMKNLHIGADYTYWWNNYAAWEFKGSNLPMGGTYTPSKTPWEMPAAGQLDVNANYSFPFGNLKATLYANINNLLDSLYITDAYNGASDDWDTAYRVFYAFGRTYSLRLKIAF